MPSRPSERLVGSLSWVSLSGAAGAAAGLGWDAVLHARDPLLAQHESVFTASNPAHLLIAAGLVLALLGQAGGMAIRLSGTARRVFAAAAALFAVGLTATGGWSWRTQAAQENAARQLVVATRAATLAYRDPVLAMRAGYEPVTPLNWPIVEWVNPRYTASRHILDVKHPERLMYISAPSGPMLAGAMFVMPRPGQPGPSIGGPLTHWHEHVDLCYLPNGTIAGTDGYGFPCPAGSSVRPTPQMLHVWIVANPAGPFAEDLSPAAIASVLASG